MIVRSNGWGHECVVVDLNTQRDFCDSSGAHPVANAEELIPALRRLIAWTKWHDVPVISSLDSHRRWELPRDGHPIHCVEGSPGQRKLEFTVFPSRTNIDVDNTLAVPFNPFKQFQQVIFPERTDDLLANPKADRLLTQLKVREFILSGNGIEGAVKALALGLIARGKRVTVVLEACGFWNRATADLTMRQIAAKGADVVHLDELLARKLPRRHRYARTAGKNGNGHGSPVGRRVAGSKSGANGLQEHKLSATPGNGRIVDPENDAGSDSCGDSCS